MCFNFSLPLCEYNVKRVSVLAVNVDHLSTLFTVRIRKTLTNRINCIFHYKKVKLKHPFITERAKLDIILYI